MSYYITLDREDIKSKIGINQNFQIFNEDCREGIKRLKDNSIDFIVTDPPYFIDGMGNEWNDKRLQNKAKKSGIIGGLPIGMKFDRIQGERDCKSL